MKTNIVRPMFCEKCFRGHHPTKGDWIAESVKNGLIAFFLNYNPPFRNEGITPHLIIEYNEKEDRIIIETFCLVSGCGVHIEKNKTNDNYTVILKYPTVYKILKNDWLALQNFFDMEYKLFNYE